MVPLRYVYLLASLFLLPLWLFIYKKRRDLREEMIVMSLILGVISVATSYRWWTLDWWRPETITGTRVGIEDFFSGFTFGGIMAVSYELLFRKIDYRPPSKKTYPGALVIALLLSQFMSILIGYVTTFYASVVSMTIVGICMLYYRKDLLECSLISAISTVLISLPVYWFIMLISPDWINATYLFAHLSNIRFTGIPIEELIFWFMAGFIFGPFHEYWKGIRHRKVEGAKPIHLGKIGYHVRSSHS